MTLVKEVVRGQWRGLVVSDQQAIMTGLLSLALESNSSIRKLSHASIAVASRGTGFCNWSDLMSAITHGLRDSESTEGRVAMLDLLQAIVDEGGGSALIGNLEIVLKSLLWVSTRPERILKRKSLSVFTALLVNLARDEETAVLNSLEISAWTPSIIELVQLGDAGSLICVVSSVKQLVEADLVDRRLESLLTQVIGESISSLKKFRPSFESLVVTSEEGGIDEDDQEGGLSSLAIKVCELLNAVAVSDVSERVLRGSVGGIFSALLPYAQITVANEQEWLADPNAFIASEEDDFAAATIRLCLEGLVADLLENPFLLAETRAGLREAAALIIQEGLVAKETENSEYWRYIEVGLFGFSHALEEDSLSNVDVVRLCANLASSSPSSPSETTHPLLKSRAFTVLFRFARNSLFTSFSQQNNHDLLTILLCSTECMHGPVTLQFAASRCFCAFLPILGAPPTDLLEKAWNCFIRMARNGVEERLHFALDCLLQMSKVCQRFVSSLGDEYVDFLLDMVLAQVADPLVPSQVLDLINSLHDAVGEAKFQPVIDTFAATLIAWLRPDREIELDVGMDFVEVFVRHASVPLIGNLHACILAITDERISAIGENTKLKVDSILRECACKMPDRYPRRESWMVDT